MRITRKMLESYISEINKSYDISLSVHYFNGYTHVYNSGRNLYTGSTPECYNALSIFMDGLHVGMGLVLNSEVV